jgi:hypothetical protein
MVFAIGIVGFARAQNQGSLSGQVTDPNQKAVVGAKVTLTEVGTQSSRDGKTNDQGIYGFTQVKPGIYTLKIEATNFKTNVQDKVQILVATPTTLNVQLTLGAMSEQIVVTAEAIPNLNTEDATIGDVMDEAKIKSLPLYARNPVGLLALQPGVIFSGGSDLDVIEEGSQSQLDIRDGTVNGVRGNQMNVTLDGSDANDQQNHAAFASALPVTLDSLQEFRVTTGQANSDEGGASGAQVALVTKSGTNDFHGNLRWYYRTTGPTAASYFANLNSVGRAKLVRNIPGGSLGGRFWRDRVFFFADFENRQDRSEVLAGPQQVPSAALADGALIYECAQPGPPAPPVCTTPTTVNGLTHTWTVPAGDAGLTPAQIKMLDPFDHSGNPGLVAQAGINPAMLTYMKLFPAGNSPGQSNDGGLAFNALSFNSPSDKSWNIYTSRMDFNITKNGHHTAFVRGTLAGISDTLSPSQFPGQPVSSTLLNNSRGIAAGYTGQFTPNIVNDFHYSFTREGVAFSGNRTSDGFSIRFFASNIAFNRGSERIVPSHEWKDDISWSHGSHTFQFGGVVDIIRNNRISEGPGFAFFQANPGNCNDCGFLQTGSVIEGTPGLAGLGLPLASSTNVFNAAYLMLTGSINVASATFLGNPKTGAIQAAKTPEVRDFAENNYGLYIRDSWKARPNLTITAGVRWEYQSPVYEVNGFQVAPTIDVYQWFLQREQNALNGIGNQASPLLSWAPAGKANGKPSWYHPNYKNFSPRVAIAWSPGYTDGILSKIFGGAGNSSVRAGFSLSYDQVGQTLATTADAEGSPGTATALSTPTTQFGLLTAPRFSGTCSLSGCAGLPPLSTFVTPPTSATFPFTPDLSTGNQDFVVDPHLKTPYVMNFSLDFQRNIGKGIVLDVAYVGTLGRRLLTKADFAESLPLTDPISHTNFYQAFDKIIALAGTTHGFNVVNTPDINPTNPAQLHTIQNIPFFTNMMPNMPLVASQFNCNPSDVACNTFYQSLTPTQAFYSTAFQILQGSLGSPSWSCAIFFMDIGPTAFGTSSPWNHALDPTGIGDVLFTPQFNGMGGWANFGWSAYHSLQVGVRKRKGNYTFAANYVFSKEMDDASTPENGGGQFAGLIYTPWDLRQQRSVGDFNLKHNFSGEFGYVLPFGHGQRFGGGANKFTNCLIGGWEVTGVVQWHSGFPQSPNEGFNFPTDFFLTGFASQSGKITTNITRNGNLAAPNNIPNLFSNSNAALALLQPTLPGFVGARNSFYGPAFSSVSMDVHKSFVMPWSDRQRLQLRVSAYNLFNSVNFGDGGLTLDGTLPNLFGQFSNTIGNPQGGGRQMEFGARFEF